MQRLETKFHIQLLIYEEDHEKEVCQFIKSVGNIEVTIVTCSNNVRKTSKVSVTGNSKMSIFGNEPFSSNLERHQRYKFGRVVKIKRHLLVCCPDLLDVESLLGNW